MSFSESYSFISKANAEKEPSLTSKRHGKDGHWGENIKLTLFLFRGLI